MDKTIETADRMRQLTEVAAGYRDDLARQVGAVGDPQWVAVMSAVIRTLEDGGQVLLAGNGGSATTATHIAADWRAATGATGLPGRVISLSDNISRLLAIANDRGFSDVFAEQIVELGRPRDLLVLVSVSGLSENLVEAAAAARRAELHVVALLGSAGELASASDAVWIADELDYGTCEDLHLSFGHCLVRALIGAPQRSTAQVAQEGVR